MKKQLLSALAVLFLAVSVSAQVGPSLRPSAPQSTLFILQDLTPADTSWKTGGAFGLNINQTYLSNWAAGGQSSVALTGLLTYAANYAKGNVSWDNNIDLAYGILSPDFINAIKVDDRIEFNSKYGRRLASKPKWYITGLANVRTQFASGFPLENGLEVRQTDSKISTFAAPLYALAALGMDYKPNENFSVFISPITFKGTLVNDDFLAAQGAFGVQPEIIDENGNVVQAFNNFRSEIGGYIQAMYKTQLVENVGFQTQINLFSNYQENPQNIDINWQTLLSMKIAKYWNVNVTTSLIYDDDIDLLKNGAEFNDAGEIVTPANIGPGVQFKQTTAIGFGYQF